jgi:hypothetical protein
MRVALHYTSGGKVGSDSFLAGGIELTTRPNAVPPGKFLTRKRETVNNKEYRCTFCRTCNDVTDTATVRAQLDRAPVERTSGGSGGHNKLTNSQRMQLSAMSEFAPRELSHYSKFGSNKKEKWWWWWWWWWWRRQRRRRRCWRRIFIKFYY